MNESKICWGIDLGGTKIEGAVFQLEPELKIFSRLRLPTEQAKGYEHVLSQIKSLIHNLEEDSKLKVGKLGIGTPGTIDKLTGTIKNSNTLCLMGKPMDKDLSSLLGIPVAMANDANCFAYAETLYGAVKEHTRDAECVFGVIMGTGVGGGIVVHNKMLNGLHGIAGEWGHNTLVDEGPDCYCGRKGCVETFISGPATEKYYEKISGKKVKASEIYQLFLTGDNHAIATIERLIKYFGKALATIVNIIDPEYIVLGGGLGNLDILYTQGKEEIKKHLFNKDFNTQFLKPKLGDSAGVIGAGLL
ncbi:MAG: ROK family protein [Saprospiraceae bacterium]|nr:ROK family protein [Saprospiraceae bacterium]